MGLSPSSSHGNGGSQPDANSLARAVLNFQETAGAGTYTAELDLPAGAHLLDCILIGRGAWAADTATLNVDDVLTGAGAYYRDWPLVDDLFDPYDPANPLIDHNYAALVTENGEYNQTGYFASGRAGPGIIYFDADTITATIVTTGAGGATGHMQVIVIGFGVPVGTVNAVKS